MTIVCVLAAFCLAACGVAGKGGAASQARQATREALQTRVAEVGVQADGGGDDWAVLGLSRDDALTDESAAAYVQAAAAYVRNNADAHGRLHPLKSTDNARLILGLLAAGADPRDAAGHDLVAALADMDYVCKQGVNGPIWTLIALDAGGFDDPAVKEGRTAATRAALVRHILKAQGDDAAWELSAQAGTDADLTAMALTALAPYRFGNDEVAEAVNAALDWLGAQQAADGSFASGDTPTCESCAQVVVALSALDIDADGDVRFVKQEGSALDALCSFALPAGGFKHVRGTGADDMATEQGYYALVAYQRFAEGKTALYDMS